MKWYRMRNDVEYLGRWFINGIRAGHDYYDWPFLSGHLLPAPKRLTTSVSERGVVLDITFAVFDIPVVTSRANTLFLDLFSDWLRSFPIEIQGYCEPFFVLNVTHAIACLDEERSTFTKWTEADDRPDKLGQYRAIYSMVLKASTLTDAQVFRVAGDHTAIIVSENVRVAVMQNQLTGVRFDSVSVA